MPIVMTCECGTKLRAKDEQAGKRIRCPSCSEILNVPDSANQAVSTKRRAASEDEDEERPASRKSRYPDRDLPEEEEKPRKKRQSSDAVQPTRRSTPSEDEDERPSRKIRARDEEEYDLQDQDEKPRKKRKLTTNFNDKLTKKTGTAPAGNAFNAGVFGGLAMMIGSSIWFVVGLMCDYIFIYPPILFIIGLVALIKGIVDGNLTGKK